MVLSKLSFVYFLFVDPAEELDKEGLNFSDVRMIHFVLQNSVVEIRRCTAFFVTQYLYKSHCVTAC